MLGRKGFSLDNTIDHLSVMLEQTKPCEGEALLMLANRAKSIPTFATSLEDAEELYRLGLALMEGLPLTAPQREAYVTCLHTDYKSFLFK